MYEESNSYILLDGTETTSLSISAHAFGDQRAFSTDKDGVSSSSSVIRRRRLHLALSLLLILLANLVP